MTPGATVCGYAVDFLRSCYSSAWRLVEGSNLETPGRFVFCPEETPHYPGWHNLGSRNWTTDERDPEPTLGEVTSYKQKWFRGAGPIPFPSAVLIGTAQAVEAGQLVEHICPWECTAENGAAWSSDLDVVRIDFEDSQNCGGSNDLRQSGVATRDFLNDTPKRLTVELTGKTERQQEFFDEGRVFLDDVELIFLHGEQELQGCLMQDVFASVTVDVDPGHHVLRFTGDTIDGRYHTGAFFELFSAFDPPFQEDTRSFIDGFDARCFLPATPAHGTRPFVPDLFNVLHMLRLAEVLDLQYTDTPGAILKLVEFLGSSPVCTGVANGAGVIPGTIIAVRPDLTVVVISGTSNYFQLATQCVFAASGPVDVGPYNTNRTWHLASLAIAERLTASGADPNGRILFVGHSYGGAVATLLAADCHRFNATRVVECLTFGAPKPGDRRLTELIAGMRLVRVASAGDPVPGLPPAYVQVLAFLGSLPAGLLANWVQLVQPPGQLVLAQAGGLSDSDMPTIDLYQIALAVTDAILDVPLPFPFPHAISEYVRRLRLTLLL